MPPAQQVAQDSQALAQAVKDLQLTLDQVARLRLQLAAAQQAVEVASAQAQADQSREDQLRREIAVVARLSYETQGSTLNLLLDARSLNDIWNAVAQGRIVANHQRELVDQLDQIENQDRAALLQATANREALAGQLDQAQGQVTVIQALMAGLKENVLAAGKVVGTGAGPVPTSPLPQTSGEAGQCTWYAEQAWVTYSDPGSPGLAGDGADVVNNLAAATGTTPQLAPAPGALVSWERPLLSPAYGHVAYVASISKDAAGRVIGYSVWEMNFVGPFQTDTRYVPWTGADPLIVFFWPPKPVNPVQEELALFGPTHS